MAFVIVAGLFLIVNALFLIASLIYTVKNRNKGEPALSALGASLDPRMSLQPQVVFYEAIVRISGNPALEEQAKEKSEKTT